MAANAVGNLLGAWPVIIPPSPGILCAYGDVTTKFSHELSSSYVKLLSDVTSDGLQVEFQPLREGCWQVLKQALIEVSDLLLKVEYEIDLRYQGQVRVPLLLRGVFLISIGNHFDSCT